jgi:predicted glycosyltransferase
VRDVKVWIDLANSPHPLLFRPIAARLQERGAEVVVTVRDHAQTRELALATWPDATVVGAASPRGMRHKSGSLIARTRALAGFARHERPDVALSHNSYAQIAAARRAGVPALTAMDYEHQPANHIAFRLADRILVPAVLPDAKLRKQGARPPKLRRYQGFKEELYLSDFEPDHDVAAGLFGPGAPPRLAVARAAPAGAAYHRRESPVFAGAIERLSRSGQFRTVVLARDAAQRRHFAEADLDHVVAPEHALDARSLLLDADVFIGAGGTMSREAALLGTPAISLFAGRPAAVDAELERRGLLTTLAIGADFEHGIDDRLRSLGGHTRAERTERLEALRRRAEALVELFTESTLELGGSPAMQPVAVTG